MSDSQEVDDALKRTIQTGALSEADKVILDPIIERTKSMEYDKLDEESKTQIITGVKKILNENGVTITTNDAGDIMFELPDKSIITHNTKTGKRTTTQSTKTITPAPTQVSSVKPTGFGSSSKRFGGNRTKKYVKKTRVGGGNDDLIKDVVITVIAFIIVGGFVLIGNFVIDLYKDSQKAKTSETTASETKAPVHMPVKGDTYVAIKEQTTPNGVYKETYNVGDSITLELVPKDFNPNKTYGSMVTDTAGNMYDLNNFEYQPSTGGSKNRKSRSKTRKQKRRRAKK